jgi:hypothetical protein
MRENEEVVLVSRYFCSFTVENHFRRGEWLANDHPFGNVSDMGEQQNAQASCL